MVQRLQEFDAAATAKPAWIKESATSWQFCGVGIQIAVQGTQQWIAMP